MTGQLEPTGQPKLMGPTPYYGGQPLPYMSQPYVQQPGIPQYINGIHKTNEWFLNMLIDRINGPLSKQLLTSSTSCTTTTNGLENCCLLFLTYIPFRFIILLIIKILAML